jgi:hypothetical protein
MLHAAFAFFPPVCLFTSLQDLCTLALQTHRHLTRTLASATGNTGLPHRAEDLTYLAPSPPPHLCDELDELVPDHGGTREQSPYRRNISLSDT